MNTNHRALLDRYLPGQTGERSGNALIVRIEGRQLASMFTKLASSLPLLTIFATDERGRFHIHYVFGLPNEHALRSIILLLDLDGTEFPSLARSHPKCALYERLIMTMFGLTAVGHPDPRSLVLQEENWPAGLYPMRKDFRWDTRVPETKANDYNYHAVEGEGIYEIPVGPIHAGIIEPGHFRFSVVGEEILGLEARLGWVHKGVEKLFENLPVEKHTALAERISGDSSFSHSLAYCQALEALAGTAVPERARYLRLIFGELERITMHIFDIANIGGNGTGFTFMAAQGFRMTEELRILSGELVGNRFLRSINVPGGVAKDLSGEAAERLRSLLDALERDFSEMMRVADASASLSNRLKGTGTLDPEIARESGIVGMGARSVGLAKDARIEYPYAAYDTVRPGIVLEVAGDVDARFRIRVKEVYESLRLIREALLRLPAGQLGTKFTELMDGIGVGVVEGWRGEVVYVVVAKKGILTRVAVRDPSFIHWQLFPHLVTADMVPDFPLINKSFNLSYSGNDL